MNWVNEIKNQIVVKDEDENLYVKCILESFNEDEIEVEIEIEEDEEVEEVEEDKYDEVKPYGFNKGFEKGFYSGYNEGCLDSWEDFSNEDEDEDGSFDEGYDLGYDDGELIGFKKGIDFAKETVFAEGYNVGLADQKEVSKCAEFGYESPDYQEGFQDGYHCGFDLSNSSTVINREDGE